MALKLELMIDLAQATNIVNNGSDLNKWDWNWGISNLLWANKHIKIVKVDIK